MNAVLIGDFNPRDKAPKPRPQRIQEQSPAPRDEGDERRAVSSRIIATVHKNTNVY